MNYKSKNKNKIFRTFTFTNRNHRFIFRKRVDFKMIFSITFSIPYFEIVLEERKEKKKYLSMFHGVP